THGMKLNFSGKLYKIVGYGVRKDDERIDFDQIAALAKEHKPKLVVAGASAYAREIDFAAFAQICHDNRALFMVDMAHIAGLVSGGTDNHLLLVDVVSRGLTGKIAEETLDHAGITVNKNKIPFDPRPPMDPSGIRIGTPALTTRGMREPEMRTIAGWIGQVLL